MNRRLILYMVGQTLKAEAALLVLPLIVGFVNGESCVSALLITIAIALLLGFGLTLLCKPKTELMFAREGFVIVALAWLVLSAVGALPFYISGEIASYVDAFFEIVSGFTTTGASILTDVEAMSRGLLFWRSFSHWVGGMGVLVFVMAIIPSVSDRSIHILRAESPGPVVGKLVPKMKDTAKILYLLYVVLTVVQIIFLKAGGMSWFDSLLHTFGTAGTGGFGIKADSLAGYSNYSQWVITIFMLIFGINFNIYFLLMMRRFKAALKSEEMWCYLGLFTISSALIVINILPSCQSLSDAIRLSAFQVSSIMTTTGYTTINYDLWPVFSRSILLFLMFIGACAGSTAGGLKMSRAIILWKVIRRELRRLLHPRSVGVVKFEGRKIDEETASSVTSYFAVYCLLYVVIVLLISIDGFSIETNIGAAASCFNNIGPAFGTAGPALSYAEYSDFSKIILSLAMLLGRLEIYPIMLALSPSTWSKK